MEIKINVPINDYQRPSKVREEVVQLICDAFLQGDEYKATCTNHWSADYCVDTEGKHPRFYNGYRSGIGERHEEHRFNGAEMSAAFEVLIKAGYFMYKGYDGGVVYKCQRRDFNNDGWQMVHSFDTRID